MKRRGFLTILSAASSGGIARARHALSQSAAATEPRCNEPQVQFGVRINDMRNDSLPREN